MSIRNDLLEDILLATTGGVSAVQSVNGKTGAVVLDGTEVELIATGGVSITQAISDLDAEKAEQADLNLTNSQVLLNSTGISDLTNEVDSKLVGVTGGTDITIDNTDPVNPIINYAAADPVDYVIVGDNISLLANDSNYTSAENISIDRVINGLSLATDQQPSGTGETNAIQIEFGAAQGTISDPVQLSAAGTLTFNEAGLYRLKVTADVGRTGGGGVSQLRLRALVDGAQAGQTIGFEIDDANTAIPFTDEAWLNIPVSGVEISYEIMRDSSGNNNGGLFQPEVTAATAPNWSPCTCAAIRVERWQ